MGYTLAELAPTLGSISPPRLRQLWNQVLGYRKLPEDKVLGDGDCLVLWLAAVLTARRLLSAELQYLVLDEYGQQVRSFGDQLGQMLQQTNYSGSGLQSAALSIIDGNQLVRFSGEEDFFDLKRLVRVTTPERPPLEFLTLDLTALFTRMRAVITSAKRNGG